MGNLEKGIIGFITLNVVALWIMVFVRTGSSTDAQPVSLAEPLNIPSEISVPFGSEESEDEDVAVSTVSAVTSATSSAQLAAEIGKLQLSLDALTERVSALEDVPAPAQSSGETTTIVTHGSVKEHIINMGSGSTQKTEWTDILDTTIELNSANYGDIKSVNFEATISIVSGEVYARLVNKSTGAVISASEVSHNSSSATLKTSGNFWLHSGSNDYVVQLRSSNGETAVLGEARIRIVGE